MGLLLWTHSVWGDNAYLLSQRTKAGDVHCSLGQHPLVTLGLYGSWWVMSQGLYNKTFLEKRWHALALQASSPQFHLSLIFAVTNEYEFLFSMKCIELHSFAWYMKHITLCLVTAVWGIRWQRTERTHAENPNLRQLLKAVQKTLNKCGEVYGQVLFMVTTQKFLMIMKAACGHVCDYVSWRPCLHLIFQVS